MKTIILNDTEYHLPHQPSDFKLGKYEKVMKILEEDVTEIEKYSNLLVELGIPEEVIDDLTIEEFSSTIKDYMEGTTYDFSKFKFVPTIEVNGRTYQAFDEDAEFLLKVKDLNWIEKLIKRNPDKYLAEVLAVIFKDIELTKTEHYTDAHIRHKASLFRENVTLDIAIPYIGAISHELLTSLQTNVTLSNDTTTN